MTSVDPALTTLQEEGVNRRAYPDTTTLEVWSDHLRPSQTLLPPPQPLQDPVLGFRKTARKRATKGGKTTQ